MTAARTTVRHGDMLRVLPTFAACSVDSCVTDPPYHLTTGKRGGSGAASLNTASPAGRARISTGFMGRAWDGGDVALRPETWAEVYRVLKPGAHLLAFGGTRTFHRMACAIEDAGFEIRDTIMWLYGTGFPKSLDVSKAIDKAAGATRRIIGPRPGVKSRGAHKGHEGYQRPRQQDAEAVLRSISATAPATSDAVCGQGWGTALKPAYEPVIVARKPLEGTVAANVLAHGTGALNIAATRVPGVKPLMGDRTATVVAATAMAGRSTGRTSTGEQTSEGRWPANVIHDGSDEVEAAFAVYGERGGASPVLGTEPSPASTGRITGRRERVASVFHADTGTASRFFYSAKATKADRAGSMHPTVKPQALMRYLVRLVTPPGGLVLDPFAGSGSTGQAALAEGFRAMLVEQDATHVADIRRRLAAAHAAARTKRAA